MPRHKFSTLPVEPRFWAKVSRQGDDECWPWIGSISGTGYGNISVNSRMVVATHVALELAGKPRPYAAHALHSCDNPVCVNPAHLRWATHAENMAEMAAKGRSGDHKGLANGRARLCPAKASAIRQSSKLLRELAAEFGVSLSTVSRARRGECWS